VPRILEELFTRITVASSGVHFNVRASFLEVYNESMFDLLSGMTAHSHEHPRSQSHSHSHSYSHEQDTRTHIIRH
jgi:hypothetical protein